MHWNQISACALAIWKQKLLLWKLLIWKGDNADIWCDFMIGAHHSFPLWDPLSKNVFNAEGQNKKKLYQIDLKSFLCVGLLVISGPHRWTLVIRIAMKKKKNVFSPMKLIMHLCYVCSVGTHQRSFSLWPVLLMLSAVSLFGLSNFVVFCLQTTIVTWNKMYMDWFTVNFS